MREININEFNYNAFNITNDWALITAGKKDKFNTMTISWATFGILWETPIVMVFIRPQRCTRKFIDEENHFTLSMFGSNFKKELARLGSISGNDTDKLKDSILTPLFLDNYISFNEASTIIECKVLYKNKLNKDSFIDTSIIDTNYINNDYSICYIGKIEKILIK